MTFNLFGLGPEKSYQDYCWTQAKVDIVYILSCKLGETQ